MKSYSESHLRIDRDGAQKFELGIKWAFVVCRYHGNATGVCIHLSNQYKQ